MTEIEKKKQSIEKRKEELVRVFVLISFNEGLNSDQRLLINICSLMFYMLINLNRSVNFAERAACKSSESYS